VGEKETESFQFTFNGFLKVAFQGSRVTSDAGLILVRELDERLGLEAIIAEHVTDSRHGLNTQFRLPDLLRQSIYSRLAGYEDLNDAARLSTDPTFRLIGSPQRWDRSAALTSTLHWFETELLTREENLVGLMAVNRDVVGQAETWDRSDRVVLDMDSSESPVHGQQEGSAYNGHFETVCYHPLFLFNDHGDCLAAKLRPGNVSSGDRPCPSRWYEDLPDGCGLGARVVSQEVDDRRQPTELRSGVSRFPVGDRRRVHTYPPGQVPLQQPEVEPAPPQVISKVFQDRGIARIWRFFVPSAGQGNAGMRVDQSRTARSANGRQRVWAASSVPSFVVDR
jgi:hypothetical protein